MRRTLVAVVCAMGALGAGAAPAMANHSWGSYHWARTSNPFTLMLGDNLSAAWDPYNAVSASDWSQSTVLDTPIVAGGSLSNPRKCRPTSGRVEVCNASYGYNGWLGVAQIWISGSHIVQGTSKMNDSYFSLARYNTPAWRQHVLCQEVGHTFGLDHQDESGASLGTCMDYANDPTNSQHPNQHDYDQLALIYQHLDSSSTVAASSAAATGSGKQKRLRDDLWVEDRGGGKKVFTFVYWSDRGVRHGPPDTE